MIYSNLFQPEKGRRSRYSGLQVTNSHLAGRILKSLSNITETAVNAPCSDKSSCRSRNNCGRLFVWLYFFFSVALYGIEQVISLVKCVLYIIYVFALTFVNTDRHIYFIRLFGSFVKICNKLFLSLYKLVL